MKGPSSSSGVFCCLLCCLMGAVLTKDRVGGTGLSTGLAVPECKSHLVVHRVEWPHCTQRRMLSLSCRGQCESYTQYSTDTNDIERVCSCCQPLSRTLRRIRLRCRNPKSSAPEWRVLQVFVPDGCMCRPCSVSVDNVPDVVNPHEFMSENPPMDLSVLKNKK